MEGIKLDALFSLLLQGPGRGCPAGPSCPRANSRPAGTGSGFSPYRVGVGGCSCCARGRPAPGPARRLRWLRPRLISNCWRFTRVRLNQISLRLINRRVVCGYHGTGRSDSGRRPRAPLRRGSIRPASTSVFPTRFSWHRTSAPRTSAACRQIRQHRTFWRSGISSEDIILSIDLRNPNPLRRSGSRPFAIKRVLEDEPDCIHPEAGRQQASYRPEWWICSRAPTTPVRGGARHLREEDGSRSCGAGYVG